MASDVDNLKARLSAITAELAAGNFKPSYTIDGENVNWTEYRQSLLDEMERLQLLIQRIGGPFTVRVRGRP